MVAERQTRNEHFKIFDELPRRVRAALREAPYNLSVSGMPGHPEDACLYAIHKTVLLAREAWRQKGWPC